MVASGHYLASLAAQRILDRGGNAVDAGVAAGLCTSVLQTDMVGLAGGGVPLFIKRPRSASPSNSSIRDGGP